MKEKVLYKTNYNWFDILVVSFFIGTPAFVFYDLSPVFSCVYLLLDLLLVVGIINKQFVFFNDRVEVVKMFLSKRRVCFYNDLQKVEYWNKGGRLPNYIIFHTKKKPKPKIYWQSITAPSMSQAKLILQVLHKAGVRVEFNCWEEEIADLKSW